jgi:hypothetical protein
MLAGLHSQLTSRSSEREALQTHLLIWTRRWRTGLRRKRRRVFGWRKTGVEGPGAEYKTLCAEKEVSRGLERTAREADDI